MVCCAAMDTAGATPGLDWLDGPSLLVKGERAADLTPQGPEPDRGRRPRPAESVAGRGRDTPGQARTPRLSRAVTARPSGPRSQPPPPEPPTSGTIYSVFRSIRNES
ncbi:hypothetical protein GCM10020295_43730 [Streptomyces cinereospinus]